MHDNRPRTADAWRAFRGFPMWVQAAAWVLAWPIVAGVAVWSSNRSAKARAVGVAVAVLGSALYYPGVAVGAGSLGAPSHETPRAIVPSDQPSTLAPSESASPLASPTITPGPSTAPSSGSVVRVQAARVTRVVDGDTFVADIAGKSERVRIIGVDTPESTTKIEPYGKEASAYTRRALDGRTVWLERDVEERDRYGRLLAYVWLAKPADDGAAQVRASMFEARLLLDGYAQLLTIPPNVKYADVFAPLQAEARNARRGLWATSPFTPQMRSGSCDPAYPEVCIPPPPPDLDCGDITHKRFKVLAPDPHNFDGDGDGLGCET